MTTRKLLPTSAPKPIPPEFLEKFAAHGWRRVENIWGRSTVMARRKALGAKRLAEAREAVFAGAWAVNNRQRRFVDEYLIDLNGTQAAIRAGYSAKTAQEQASRLLSNVMVSAAIAEAKADRSEQTKVDAAWLLTRLAQESVADLSDLYREDGQVKPVHEWPLIWRQGLVAGVEVEQIGEGAGHVTKIKISDRIKRLELIGKHIDVQAFKERIEHTGGLTVVVDAKDAAL